MGRFELLEQTLPRITSPLVRGKKDELEECSLDSAAQRISGGLSEAKDSFAGMASSKLPSETLSLFNRFISEVIGSDSIDTPDGASYRIISEGISKFADNGKGLDIECPIEEILEADCILVIGADPETTNPVVSTLTRRAVSQGKAKLIVINSARDVFPLWTDLWLRPRAGSEGTLLTGLAKVLVDKGLAESGKVGAELKTSLSQYEIGEVTRTTGIEKKSLEQVAEMYARAERGVIIYGDDLLKNNGAGSVTTILNLASITANQVGHGLRVISLKPGANSRGAWELGLAKGIKQDRPKGLYLLLSDDTGDERLLNWLRGIDFLVVQASYHSPVTAMADVVLPSPIWAEREGKYVDMDGRVLEIKQVLRPGDGVLQDKEVLMGISQKLGKGLVLS
jgi:predicted molibdopterin-dependent oxidoreductase YjgC